MAGWLWDQMDNDVKNRNGEEPHLGQQSFFFFFLLSPRHLEVPGSGTKVVP